LDGLTYGCKSCRKERSLKYIRSERGKQTRKKWAKSHRRKRKTAELKHHYDLTLVEVVDMLGLPDYLDYYPPHPEIPGVNIDFIWTEKNISTSGHLIRIDQTEALQANIGLPRTLPIMWILYTVSDRFDSPPSGVRIQWPGYAD